MKNKKQPIFPALLTGFLSYLLFRMFWDHVYPKLGIELNRNITFLCFFAIAALILFLYNLKRYGKNKEEYWFFVILFLWSYYTLLWYRQRSSIKRMRMEGVSCRRRKDSRWMQKKFQYMWIPLWFLWRLVIFGYFRLIIWIPTQVLLNLSGVLICWC